MSITDRSEYGKSLSRKVMPWVNNNEPIVAVGYLMAECEALHARLCAAEIERDKYRQCWGEACAMYADAAAAKGEGNDK